MIIADTSVWIEYLRGCKEHQDILNLYLERREVYALSPIFGELFQGLKGKREFRIIQGFWENLPKVDEQNLFVEAGRFSNHFRWKSKGIGLIDGYIIAAALKYNFALWTEDKKMAEAYEDTFLT